MSLTGLFLFPGRTGTRTLSDSVVRRAAFPRRGVPPSEKGHIASEEREVHVAERELHHALRRSSAWASTGFGLRDRLSRVERPHTHTWADNEPTATTPSWEFPRATGGATAVIVLWFAIGLDSAGVPTYLVSVWV